MSREQEFPEPHLRILELTLTRETVCFKSPLGKLFQLDSVLLFGFLFHGLTRFYDFGPFW